MGDRSQYNFYEFSNFFPHPFQILRLIAKKVLKLSVKI